MRVPGPCVAGVCAVCVIFQGAVFIQCNAHPPIHNKPSTAADAQLYIWMERAIIIEIELQPIFARNPITICMHKEV